MTWLEEQMELIGKARREAIERTKGGTMASKEYEIYDAGYKAGRIKGYDRGYDEGYVAGKARAANTAEPKEAFNRGFAEGWSKGYDAGEAIKTTIIFDAGYTEGKASAADAAKEDADTAFQQGLVKGFNNGYDAGFASGLARCRRERPFRGPFREVEDEEVTQAGAG